MSQDRGAADRLNDHLDAAAAGDATRSHALDPAIVATVERFFAADDAPGPPPGLADHLWRELIHQTASVECVPLIPALRPHRNGRTPIDSSAHHAAQPWPVCAGVPRDRGPGAADARWRFRGVARVAAPEGSRAAGHHPRHRQYCGEQASHGWHRGRHPPSRDAGADAIASKGDRPGSP